MRTAVLAPSGKGRTDSDPMESLGYAVTVALLALVPSLGSERAKTYGDAVAHASIESGVDPWLLVAIGRIETNWNADNLGTCCGGVMSIRWRGWARWAESHGFGTDPETLRGLARDPTRSIQLAARAVASLRQMCGRRHTLVASAYQTGRCHVNDYGRRAARIASRYRARFAPLVGRHDRQRRRAPFHFPAVSFTFGTPVAPLATTSATLAAGP